MNTYASDKILKAIWKREDLEAEKISVKKLLKAGGVEQWTNLCCNRISENDLLDGNEAVINLSDFPDIELTSMGLLQCKEILLFYVSDDLLKVSALSQGASKKITPKC